MKKQNIIFLVLFLLLIVSSVYSQVSKLADLWINGDDWEKCSKDFKIGYVAGRDNAICELTFMIIRYLNEMKMLYKEMSEQEMDKVIDSIVSPMTAIGVNFEQAVIQIDEIYKDHSNKPIPVPYLIPLVYMKERGEISIEDMKKHLQKLRIDVLKEKKQN